MVISLESRLANYMTKHWLRLTYHEVKEQTRDGLKGWEKRRYAHEVEGDWSLRRQLSEVLDDNGKKLLQRGLILMEGHTQSDYTKPALIMAPTFVVQQFGAPLPYKEILGAIYTPEKVGGYVLDDPSYSGPLLKGIKNQFFEPLKQLVSKIKGNYNDPRLQPLKEVSEKVNSHQINVIYEGCF